MPKSILNNKLTSQTQGKILEFSIALLLILMGVSLRFLPHPPNFAPIVAIALFSGAYLSRKIALILPLATMAISDVFIGYYEPKLMASVYGSFLLCVVLGFWLKKHKRWYTVLGSSLLSATLFFVITNFAVWAFTPWYEKSIFGLIQCYLMALPFFRNALLGNLFYATSLFGIYEAVDVWIRKKFSLTKPANEYGYIINKSTLV